MNFSKEWDEAYKANMYLSIWPWSDMVSYVLRYVHPDKKFRVLELGCGAGANIPFFRHLGVEYFAVEGSPAVVEKLHTRFPELKDNILIGDFTEKIPVPGLFDLVVDRASLTHNTTAAIKNCLSLIHSSLKPGGKYVGIDWFSITHSEYKKGREGEDIYTRCGYVSGQFTNVGRVHFSDKAHLAELFSAFNIGILEHKIIRREIPYDEHVFASYNLVAEKGGA